MPILPLNSTQLYVKSLLDNLTIPGPPGQPSSTLEAWIQPPVLEEATNPRAYIWGGRQRGKRQTMPRMKNGDPSTAGFKELDYTLDIYLSYLTTPDAPDADQEFPLLIDTVLAQLWSTTMPVFITSQGVVTSSGFGLGSSQILMVGEEWELEYPPERTPATMRMIYYSCRIGMDIREAVQA